MANKPFYEQEYHEKPNDIPDFSFGQIFKNFFTQAFNWNARDTRKNYWIGYAIQLVCQFVLMIIFALGSLPSYRIVTDNVHDITAVMNRLSPITIVVGIIVFLLTIYLRLCLLGTAIRRLHDTDHAGWWILLYFVPSVGWILVLYFMVIPTVEEPVRWGGYLENE